MLADGQAHAVASLYGAGAVEAAEAAKAAAALAVAGATAAGEAAVAAPGGGPRKAEAAAALEEPQGGAGVGALTYCWLMVKLTPSRRFMEQGQ